MVQKLKLPLEYSSVYVGFSAVHQDERCANSELLMTYLIWILSPPKFRNDTIRSLENKQM